MFGKKSVIKAVNLVFRLNKNHRKIKIPLAPIEEQIKFINMWSSEKNMFNIDSITIDDFQKKIQSRIEKIWSN